MSDHPPLTSKSLTSQWFCRITHDNGAFSNIFRHHCTHAHHGALSDTQRLARPTLLDNGPGTNISIIFYNNVTVTFHTWSKRDVIPHNTIMGYITVNIGMKRFSDFHV